MRCIALSSALGVVNHQATHSVSLTNRPRLPPILESYILQFQPVAVRSATIRSRVPPLRSRHRQLSVRLQKQTQLITEIYNQRRYELLGTGLRWEDSRRRNLIRGPVAAPGVPLDGQRCWLPYALGDRNSNPNVPADPAEPTTFPSGCTY